jgi:hypothetical protein
MAVHCGAPHSIQALGEDGCEFLLVFNQGNFSEESTLLLSDWLKHTPPEILQQNFGLTAKAIENLPKGEPLYIFRSEERLKPSPDTTQRFPRNATLCTIITGTKANFVVFVVLQIMPKQPTNENRARKVTQTLG